MARAAMKSWDDEFGYELIDHETKLRFPPGRPGALIGSHEDDRGRPQTPGGVGCRDAGALDKDESLGFVASQRGGFTSTLTEAICAAGRQHEPRPAWSGERARRQRRVGQRIRIEPVATRQRHARIRSHSESRRRRRQALATAPGGQAGGDASSSGARAPQAAELGGPAGGRAGGQPGGQAAGPGGGRSTANSPSALDSRAGREVLPAPRRPPQVVVLFGVAVSVPTAWLDEAPTGRCRPRRPTPPPSRGRSACMFTHRLEIIESGARRSYALKCSC